MYRGGDLLSGLTEIYYVTDWRPFPPRLVPRKFFREASHTVCKLGPALQAQNPLWPNGKDPL